MMPLVRPQPMGAAWLELEARVVISSEQLLQQLAISAAPGQFNPVGQGLMACHGFLPAMDLD